MMNACRLWLVENRLRLTLVGVVIGVTGAYGRWALVQAVGAFAFNSGMLAYVLPWLCEKLGKWWAVIAAVAMGAAALSRVLHGT